MEISESSQINTQCEGEKKAFFRHTNFHTEEFPP